MPEASLWTLVISLILLALGLTYKIADIRHTLKRTKDELSTARSEITALNEKYNKQIQDIQIQHDARIEELTKKLPKDRIGGIAVVHTTDPDLEKCKPTTNPPQKNTWGAFT